MNEDEQRKQWESTYTSRPDFFGAEPSDLAVRAAALRAVVVRVVRAAIAAAEARQPSGPRVLHRGRVAHC